MCSNNIAATFIKNVKINSNFPRVYVLGAKIIHINAINGYTVLMPSFINVVTQILRYQASLHRSDQCYIKEEK